MRLSPSEFEAAVAIMQASGLGEVEVRDYAPSNCEPFRSAKVERRGVPNADTPALVAQLASLAILTGAHLVLYTLGDHCDIDVSVTMDLPEAEAEVSRG